MSSFEKKDEAIVFKEDEPSESSSSKFLDSQTEDRKDKSSTDETSSSGEERLSNKSTSTDDDKSWISVSSSGEDSSYDDETSKEDISPDDEMCSEDETSKENEIEEEYNSEDNLISALYRQVVDDIMDSKKLTDSVVDTAIRDIKRKMHKGHKRGYRKFPRIDFSRPENCCAYLRRYAIGHTGLVKKMMWTFFANENNISRAAKEVFISNSHLKIVSLGGGPGNDLVGFCSALQEIPNSVENLELTVVDICTGWKNVFDKILNKAKDANFGSFSQCALKNINTNFIEADLTNGDVFRDANLSAALDQADIIFMMKLISHLPSYAKADPVIYNVVDGMKPNAKLVFIDNPYNGDFFSEIESLDSIYYDALRYELSFNPMRTQSPSIASTFAHVAVYQKKKIQDEDSSCKRRRLNDV